MHSVQHLHWRAGFGLSPKEWQEKRHWSVEEAVDRLFREAAQSEPLAVAPPRDIDPRQLDREKIIELRKQERRKVGEENLGWITRMADPREPSLTERMALFWHGHFACEFKNSRLALTQLNTLRRHGLGNFRELVLGIARDVAMIRYLNNQQNRKQQPNENFARELMELFTIGRGNYTERDVKEAARAFTGWSSNIRGEYVFRSFQHDYGRKTFLGKTGNFNGDDIIDIILERRETADFISGKIYRYFVNDQLDPAIHRELSRQFYDSGYDIAALMRTIFTADWFYHPKNKGAKIKSPVELLAGMMRQLEVRMDNPLSLFLVQRALGQTLFNPPNVAGWPSGKSWIDNSTLLLRLNLGAYLLKAAKANIRPKDSLKAQQRQKGVQRLTARINLQPFLEHLPAQETALFSELKDYFLVTETSLSPRLVNRMTGGGSREDFVKAGILALLSLPEYQVC